MKREFRGLSAAEFFYRNREIAGFSNPVRALYQTVRELVENSLDATEMFGILPEIYVKIWLSDEKSNRVFVRVEDNGIGIPPDEIPKVFARVFYGTKYVLRQTRGVFGLGVKMAVLYAQITTGEPVYVKSSTPSLPIIAEYKLSIDIKRNIPIILEESIFRKTSRWHGTVVQLCIEGNWQQARRRIEEYIRRTALITPYASMRLEGPDLSLEFKRVTKIIPQPPKIGKPHPYGVDVEMLKSIIEGFSNKEARLKEFLMESFDSVGETIAENFLKWARIKNKKLKDLTLEDITELSEKMRDYPEWRRPRAATLSPLGEDLLKRGVKEILKPEYVAAVTRKPSSYGGNPFIVEVALAWGGELPLVDKPILLRFANKIPLLYDEGADISRKIVENIDWSLYKVKFPAPLAVVVHVCSTKIPFKGVGKEAIADVPELEKEIANAIKEAGRRLRAHLTRVEKKFALERKRITFEKYIPVIADSLSTITGTPRESIEKKLREIMLRILGSEILIMREEAEKEVAKVER